MNCYGIGLTRLMGAVAEIWHNDAGLIWPQKIAPFTIHLLELSGGADQEKISKEAQKIYDNLQKAGLTVLYDQREEKSAGEKLNDADLLGMPYRVLVSPKTIAQESVEVKKRSEDNVQLVKIEHLTRFDFGSNENLPWIVVSRQAARLKQLWTETHPDVQPEDTQRHFIEGSISGGWVLKQGDIQQHLLSDSEIFGWSRPQPRRRPMLSTEAPETIYADLKPGDWVVHVDHGIGQFIGLHTPNIEGAQREYLAIAYKDNDVLYVPIHQADRITRYIGPDSGPPTLSRLGGADWDLTKSRVRHAVVEVAQDLLELYAKRQTAEGYAFEPDNDWQKELEASFPYIETPDQLLAIQQVKADMESNRPMDRLLCGDVGYGKTEVALRAAFKAVMSGKQVAVLVPTTVLAQQHYETFRQRLSVFPVTVEMLSRFRSNKAQDEIIRLTAENRWTS